MRPRALVSLIASLAAVPFVALLVAVLAVDGASLAMDRWWAGVVAGRQTPWLTTVEKVVSDLGGGLLGGVVVPGILALVVWRLRSRRAAAVFVVVEIVSLAAVQVVKLAVGRPRPPTALMPDAFNSFPSGHVANAATMTLLLAILVSGVTTRVIAVVWPLLMLSSRTYLGMHWLSDTIAGASLGVTVVLVCAPTMLVWARWPFRRSSAHREPQAYREPQDRPGPLPTVRPAR